MIKRNKVKQTNLTWYVTGAVLIALVGMFAFSVQAQGVRSIFCKVGILDCTFSVDAYTAVLANLLPEEDVLGAGASHATDPSIVVGNVERFYDRQIMRQGSNIVCSFLSPASTSTPKGLVSFEVGSTTSLSITVAKATSASATTTTLISDVTLAANIHGTIDFTPAVASTLDATHILAPLTFVNISIKGDVPDGGADYTGAKPVGSCNIEFFSI